MCVKTSIVYSEIDLAVRDVHYGTFRGSGIFFISNLYFESRISNPIPEKLVSRKMS